MQLDGQYYDLIPNGSTTRVTKANLVQFLYLYSHHLLNKSIHRPARSFALGFNAIIPLLYIRLFSPRELGLLISGDESIDLNNMQQYTVYNGYAANEPYIRKFPFLLIPRTYLIFVTCYSLPSLFHRCFPPTPVHNAR